MSKNAISVEATKVPIFLVDFIEHSYVKDKIIAAIEKDPEGEEYSNILELPKDVTPTHLQDPYNTENVIEPKGEEGQILIFPSTFIHKTPVSQSEGRRTFVSWSLL